MSSAIATSNSSWFATSWLVRWMGLGDKRTFDEQEFRRDVVRLLLLYRQSGYMRVEVDTLVRRTAKDAFITFRITEGPPVLVTELDITGVAGVLDTAALRRDLPLAVGDPFDRFLMQASADTIASRLRNSGYPDAEVLRNFTSDADSLRATVRFDAEPGTFTRIGAIRVAGLRHIDTTTVLRSLAVHPHEMFRQNQLYESQRELYGLGLFNSATVSLADTGERGPGDSLATVLVQVTEGPRHRLRAGAGYGSVDCLRAQAGWTALNFLGGGRSLDLTARVSKLGIGAPTNIGLQKNLCYYLYDSTTVDHVERTSEQLNYSLGATLGQPAFFSPRHRASIGLFAERRSEYQAYVRQDVGANATVTFNARRTVPVSIGYGVSVGRTSADPAVYCSVFRVCTDSDRAFLAKTRRFAAVTV
ncbi:MAG TPA: POTRA domain-containing protein, partial [Gemmatimonadales bacterium]